MPMSFDKLLISKEPYKELKVQQSKLSINVNKDDTVLIYNAITSLNRCYTLLNAAVKHHTTTQDIPGVHFIEVSSQHGNF